MTLCRVIGNVVSTIKNAELTGNKLLIVQPVDLDGRTALGRQMIAVDNAQAGEDDLVLVNREGGSARQVLKSPKTPAQAVIVAVVDDLDVPEQKNEP